MIDPYMDADAVADTVQESDVGNPYIIADDQGCAGMAEELDQFD